MDNKNIYILLAVLGVMQFGLSVCLSVMHFIKGGAIECVLGGVWALCAVCWLMTVVLNAKNAKKSFRGARRN